MNTSSKERTLRVWAAVRPRAHIEIIKEIVPLQEKCGRICGRNGGLDKKKGVILTITPG
jgi:hypothetical protein